MKTCVENAAKSETGIGNQISLIPDGFREDFRPIWQPNGIQN